MYQVSTSRSQTLCKSYLKCLLYTLALNSPKAKPKGVNIDQTPPPFEFRSALALLASFILEVEFSVSTCTSEIWWHQRPLECLEEAVLPPKQQQQVVEVLQVMEALGQEEEAGIPGRGQGRVGGEPDQLAWLLEHQKTAQRCDLHTYCGQCALQRQSRCPACRLLASCH